MSEKQWMSMDGNAAAAYSAHAMSEVVAIYPITPSSPMAEAADEFSANERKNVFGSIPTVYEMQSEGGAVAAIHGAMATGTLTTTFTASQGLLLMIPSMYKIAGEMLPTVFNVSARTLSTHALSIFGDHSDVMACRQTGFAMLASANQQEIMDQAAISMAASIKSSLPFIHFFDGFRSSHEIAKVELLSDETMRALIDDDALARFRSRALNPDRPVLKGTAMNPDIWFQGAEARNRFYQELPGCLEEVFAKFEKLTGRRYRAFEYTGDPQAEMVIVSMGSGSEVVSETVNWLNANRGSKLGAITVKLYRPFDIEAFLKVIPASVGKVAVLDRTKEPGSPGDPLYLDVLGAFDAARRLGKQTPLVIGGRYGLSSKDFTPNHVNAVIRHMLNNQPEQWKHGFAVGIEDDVTNMSLPMEEVIDTESKDVHRLKFWGLGSDGTVGANKNTIKIIGDNSDMCVQGHFVYDSKKAGGTTISHLRFDENPILSHYEVDKPDFVAIHNHEFLGKYELLAGLQQGGTVLLNTNLPIHEIFASFPEREQKIMIERNIRLFAIDANQIVRDIGMAGRINTTMQAAFFKITGILDQEIVDNAVEKAIKKTYGKKGEKIVNLNIMAYKKGLESYEEVPVPSSVGEAAPLSPELQPLEGDEAVRPILKGVIEPITHFEGDKIPVSAVPMDGVFPTGTTRYEKRSIATHVPLWNTELCVQCGRCAFVCPHAAIRTKVVDTSKLELSAEDFPTIALKAKDVSETDRFRVQVFPDDCTGCGVCTQVCIGKDKETGERAIKLVPKGDVIENLRASEKEFLRLDPTDPKFTNNKTVKGVQLIDPLFEFSGACPGCGETPYIKLATQLVGDHMIQANATGCSSIYGGTAPTIPYSKNRKGQGPAWASSLFEDNAEFGLGMRLGVEYLQQAAFDLKEEILADANADAELKKLLSQIAPIPEQTADPELYGKSKEASEAVREMLKDAPEGSREARLCEHASYLTDMTVIITGGDGWAYDIGYGGLDHVVASGKNVNILVLDTEVYSNTGGQRSKSTFMGGVAKFAAAGKDIHKKDLGMMAMNYRNVYVTSINFSADMNHTIKAMREAFAYPGTSLIIGWSTCIEHGVPMFKGPELGKLAVDCGYWLMYRYDPRLMLKGKNPLQLDSKEPTKDLREFLMSERRFSRLADERPKRAEALFTEGQRFVTNRYNYYKTLSELSFESWLKPDPEA